ncbi:GDYXXLXY domain-containing protein [Pseudovibrio exalbescens]|uniref:GDYXXLXY domain-containing protein n=1 Tax=Pseudovibrio exalbescens TaxID=197461 RepID=UPI002366681C|nr:GDYXXLXY domain-containing protein [Pseudovibrio exalbescens]MDD7910652.1 GDYXXLXY domain-containing protein [Pseudovibrio exalbescens]
MNKRSSFVLDALRFGALAVVLIVLVLLPLFDRLQTHWAGEPVVLELRPIDPRDLLRGDYVILNLALTRISSEDLPESRQDDLSRFENADTLWVGLEPQAEGKPAKLMRVISDRAEGEAGLIWLKGRVKSHSFSSEKLTTLGVDYGLDAFYVPEGKGLMIEDLPADEVQLVALVDPEGDSVAYQLLHNGKELVKDAGL